jgi:hypothetical protein
MIRLIKALDAFGTSRFKSILKKELEQLNADQLPLQQGLSMGSYALDDTLNVMIISVGDDAHCIHVKAGVFYSGIVAGCSCADDPTPLDENSEYCEVRINIDKKTAVASVALLD